MKLYDYAPSGNGYKVRLLLAHLGIKYERIEVDSNAGGTQTPEFLKLNPNGKIPTVVLDDGNVLPESNAILYYFAEGTPYLPEKKLDRAQALRWMFFEQYSHEPYISVARNIITYLRQRDAQMERLRDCWHRGAQALDVMERRLAAHDWLTDAGPTAADLALCGYTQAADEGEFDLARWPGVRAWVNRVLALPGVEALPKPR